MRRLILKDSEWDTSLGLTAWYTPDHNVTIEISKEQEQLIKLVRKCLINCDETSPKAMEGGYFIMKAGRWAGDLYRSNRVESEMYYDTVCYILVSPKEVLYVVESNDLAIRMAYNLTEEFDG